MKVLKSIIREIIKYFEGVEYNTGKGEKNYGKKRSNRFIEKI